MFISMFFYNYIRAKVPTLNTPAVLSAFLTIVVLTSAPNPAWYSIAQRIIAVLTGAAITLVCNILFWPVSALALLKQQLSLTLSHIASLFELSIKIFLHDSSLAEQERAHQLLEACRTDFSTLSNLLEKAKYEFSYDILNMREKEKVKKRI